MNLLLIMALSCPPTKVKNLTNFPWNAFDQKSLEHATKRCGQIYIKSPCLKVFRKVDERDYQATCGSGTKNK
jgi:hypothetical protein